MTDLLELDYASTVAATEQVASGPLHPWQIVRYRADLNMSTTRVVMVDRPTRPEAEPAEDPLLAFFAAARDDGRGRPLPTRDDNQAGSHITPAVWTLQAETLPND